ncbi:MAG: helix-turn-helix domain-containing protein [Pseudomonadota bacterium]
MALLSRQEAAEYLGLKKHTLEVWAVRGGNGLRYIKIGRLVRYRQEDLDDFIHTRTLGDATPENMDPSGKWKTSEASHAAAKINLPATKAGSDLHEVFNHWKSWFNQGDAVLDVGRAAIIRSAINLGYSVAQLCKAIEGCSYSEWHMGRNADGQVHNGLHIILKEGAQIDKFIGYANNPPKILRKIDQHMKDNFNETVKWQQYRAKKDA